MSKWWCQYCNSVVQPEHVTYEETHDPRTGGCGGVLHGGDSAPTGELVWRIAEQEARIKELEEREERYSKTKIADAQRIALLEAENLKLTSLIKDIHDKLYDGEIYGWDDGSDEWQAMRDVARGGELQEQGDE